jgi:hypothetical protein
MTRGKRLAALAATAAATFALPQAAGAVVLYDQTDHAAPPTADSTGPNFAPSNFFGSTDFDRTADDFTVPVGERWTIDQVDVTGALESPKDSRVNLYGLGNNDGVGTPGGLVFTRQNVTATNSPNYSIGVTGAPAIGPGRYWLIVQKLVGSGGYWSWGTRTIQTGFAAKWIYSGIGSSKCPVSATWYPRKTCWESQNPDQVFELSGTRTEVPPPDTSLTKKPKRRTTSRNVKFAFASDDPKATFECKLDDAAFKACTSPKELRVTRGKHVFRVRAVSKDGGPDPTPAKARFKVVKRQKG